MKTQNRQKITSEQFKPAFLALLQHERRKSREEHPEGWFDKASRWYPSNRDGEVIANVREPSRSYPHSYNQACRSLAHCERYHEADHEIVLLIKRELRKQGKEVTSKGVSALLEEKMGIAEAIEG